jgi:hypothetical protein
MENYNTLHIFGYGECQIISENENKKVSTELCPSAQAVVDMIYSFKPADNNASSDYRNINIFNDMFADYSSFDGFFRVEYSELNTSLINDLIIEIKNA